MSTFLSSAEQNTLSWLREQVRAVRIGSATASADDLARHLRNQGVEIQDGGIFLRGGIRFRLGAAPYGQSVITVDFIEP
jgi:hypothetical protein